MLEQFVTEPIQFVKKLGQFVTEPLQFVTDQIQIVNRTKAGVEPNWWWGGFGAGLPGFRERCSKGGGGMDWGSCGSGSGRFARP